MRGLRPGLDPLEPAGRRPARRRARRKPAKGRRAGRCRRSRSTGAKLERWEGLCRELGEKPADVALAWLLHNPVVTAPIIGPRTMEQLDGSLRALEIKLSDETLTSSWTRSSRATRPAPEDYAW